MSPRENEPDQILPESGIVEEWSECFLCPTGRAEEESTSGVGTWARTDSPATPTTTQQ